MYAHFQLLRRLAAGAEKVRFYLDVDPALRGACLSAFHDLIRDKRCDVFHVKIAKRVGRDTKESVVGQAWAEFDQRLKEVAARIEAGETLATIDPEALSQHWEADLLKVTDAEIAKALERRRERRKQRRRGEPRDPKQKAVEAFVRRLMIKAAVTRLTPSKKSGDKWLTHPMPSLAEPKKMVALITDPAHLQEDQMAHLYDRASLHGIDQFFMQLRRRINMAERALNTATAGREYHIYQPYDPMVLAKLIEIMRVYYNYVTPGKQDRKTPAMRLGLLEKPATVEEILEFRREDGARTG